MLNDLKDKTITFVKKNDSKILKWVGVSCFVGATVTAIWATPKAVELLRKRKLEQCRTKLSVLDILKTTWKLYLPTFSLIGTGLYCVVKSSNMDKKRNAILIANGKMWEETYKEYKNSVIETLGEKKEKNIRNNISKRKVENDDINSKTIILTNNGNTLFQDSLSNQYFRSDIDTVKKIINKMNARINSENYISLDELYHELGIESTRLSSEYGWQAGNLIEIEFNPVIAKNDEACICLEYLSMPKLDYARFA